MKVLYQLLLFAILSFFSSCYKYKACFEDEIFSGEIVQELRKCSVQAVPRNVDISDAGGQIYVSKDSYNKDVSSGLVCGNENIDFNKYSLLRSSAGSYENSFFKRNLEYDTINKIIHYTCIETKSRKRFRFDGRVVEESTFFLINKVGKDYKLITKYSFETCD